MVSDKPEGLLEVLRCPSKLFFTMLLSLRASDLYPVGRLPISPHSLSPLLPSSVWTITLPIRTSDCP